MADNDYPKEGTPTDTKDLSDSYTHPMSTDTRQMLEDRKNYGRNKY